MAAAAASAVLLALTWLASFHVEFLQRTDQKVFLAFYDLTFQFHWPRVNDTLHVFVALCNPRHYVFLAAFAVLLPLPRKAFALACAAGVVLIGANLTTLVLKAVLPEPHASFLVGLVVPVPYPRWPSGHSTAAMALVLALVLAVPRRLRPVTAGVGAVFAAAVGYALLAFGTHLPSDVFGGFLVASVWGFAAIAGLIFAENDRGVRQAAGQPAVWLPQALVSAAAALLVLAASAAIVVLLSPHTALSYAGAHKSLVIGGLAIAALSTVISTAVVLGLRGSRT